MVFRILVGHLNIPIANKLLELRLDVFGLVKPADAVLWALRAQDRPAVAAFNIGEQGGWHENIGDGRKSDSSYLEASDLLELLKYAFLLKNHEEGRLIGVVLGFKTPI